MALRHEYFGDPELVSDDLAPLSGGKRNLVGKQLAILFAATVVAPVSYGFAVVHGKLGLLGALLAFGGAVVVVTVAAWLLTPSAVRYGIGFVLLCRAALGPRGALLLQALRWGLGVLLVSLWALDSASWLRKLLVVFAETNQVDLVLPWLTYRVDGLEVAPATWLAAAMLLLLAYGVARQPLPSIASWALGSGLLALLLGCGLVVFAGIQSKGFGAWIEREPPLAPLPLLVAGSGAALLLWPALVSAADWVRFCPGEGAGRLVRPLWSAVAMLPAALLQLFFGALIASASLVVRGSMDGHPIPDAVAYGGMAAGGGAVLLSVALFALAAPLVGFYSPGQALAGMAPQRLSFSWALAVTLVVSLLAVPLLGQLDPSQLGIERWLLLLAAPSAVLLADALVVRRGRMVLEELYRRSSDYGPLFGVSAAGVLALATGWLFHPTVWRWLLAEPLDWPLDAAAGVGVSGDEVAVTVLGMVVAAATYLLLAILERRLAPQLLGWADQVRERIAAWRAQRQRQRRRAAAIADRKRRRQAAEAAEGEGGGLPLPLDDEETPLDPP